MRHGSLFSGIGGFDLAAEWIGWENVFHCEWNDFGKKVLNYYWPNAISYDDITKTDFTIHRGTIDILTGGFPCQPFSAAGKRKGTADDRHLWPEMLRAIREIKPTWIVGENVSGIISWDGGLVFEQVQIDLEAEGYEVQAVVLPACGVNAPHRRDRVWIVAYANNSRGIERSGINGNWKKENEGRQKQPQPEYRTNGSIRSTPNTRLFGQKIRQQQPMGFKQLCKKRVVANPESDKSIRRRSGGLYAESSGADAKGFTANTTNNGPEPSGRTRTRGTRFEDGSIKNFWQNFPTQSPVCFGNDGISFKLDGITFPKWRNESIKAAGNAIVPQVVYQIFKVIDTWKQ